MNVGSLFSGIGGFDLGLERAGMRTVWFCEQDEFCQRVLARHWPGVPCYSDVRNLRDPEPVDVLAGGFPCQDLSVAGKGAGLDGERSGLWSEYARLIGELRPRYVIVENVPALLARGFGRVLGDLAALGYDAEWDCIPASAFGAPHRRDRVWVVAYPNGEGLQGRSLSGVERSEVSGVGNGGALAHPQDERHGSGTDQGRPLHDALCRRHGASEGEVRTGRYASFSPSWWEVEPPVGRLVDGLPNRVDQLRSLGNALLPQIAEWIGSRVIEYERQTNPVRW